MCPAAPVTGEGEEHATSESALSLYYFDIDDGRQVSCDKLGTELANLEAVADGAVAVLAGIVKDNPRQSGSHCALAASVRNKEGRVIFKATLTLQSEWL
jgi:hypothetical protein